MIVMLTPSSSGVAALRLSVPLTEGPSEGGAGELLRNLAQSRMEGLARPIGARTSVTRTPRGLAYAVEGAVADLEYLAYLLREGAGEPNLSPISLGAARQRAQADIARVREAPGPRILDLLRRRVAPNQTAARGTPSSVATLDAGRIRDVWARSHQADVMYIVVAAAVPLEVVLASTRGLGAPAQAGSKPSAAPAPRDGDPRIDTLRRWYGRAWWAGSPSDPVGPVAALLIAETVAAQADGFEAGVELWELQDRWSVAVLGAAYRADISRLRASVANAVIATKDGLTEAEVTHAVARVRRDVLLGARTPGGRVAMVGRGLDSTGRPETAARYVDALDRIDSAAVERFLSDMVAGGFVEAEVRP